MTPLNDNDVAGKLNWRDMFLIGLAAISDYSTLWGELPADSLYISGIRIETHAGLALARVEKIPSINQVTSLFTTHHRLPGSFIFYPTWRTVVLHIRPPR